MDCSPPGFSVHGILQARILEWVAISSSKGSSRLRDQTQVSCIAAGFFMDWATREALELIYGAILGDIYAYTLLPEESHGWRSQVGSSPWGREESDTTERLHFHFSLSCIGEGNGNPLQCSCLENSRDGGACWAAVYGVAQSQTWLKWLSSSSMHIHIPCIYNSAIPTYKSQTWHSDILPSCN